MDSIVLKGLLILLHVLEQLLVPQEQLKLQIVQLENIVLQKLELLLIVLKLTTVQQLQKCILNVKMVPIVNQILSSLPYVQMVLSVTVTLTISTLMYHVCLVVQVLIQQQKNLVSAFLVQQDMCVWDRLCLPLLKIRTLIMVTLVLKDTTALRVPLKNCLDLQEHIWMSSVQVH